MEQEFQLFQKRDFSALVSDTIQFFKTYWKPFFKNYLIINGALLLVMAALYFLLFKDIFSDLFSGGRTQSIELFDSNPVLFFTYLFLLMVFGCIFALFVTLYPMVFLRKLKDGVVDMSPSDILNAMKADLGRMFLFGIATTFLFMLMMIVVLPLCIVLCFILIGIPALIFSFPAFFVWANQAAYVYLEQRTGYFEALRKGWKILFTKFFHYTGSTIIVYILLSVISSVFTVFPSMIVMGISLGSGGNPNEQHMSVLVIVFYVIGLVLSYIGSNLLYIQQGLIYYSAHEADVNHQAFKDIDNIGQNEA